MGRLRNGVGVGISNIPTLSSRRAFSPLSLFADGSQGVWYDDSLTSSMFQDSANTAAVLESPVGLQLDLSQGLALGPDIQNGGFDSDTVWTKNGWVIAAGVATSNVTAGITQNSPVTLAVGDWVRVTVTVSANSSGFVYAFVAGNISATLRTGAIGTFTWYFNITTVTNQQVGIYTANGPIGIVIDNVSIVRISGNHRFQATSANRPTLSARYNLLTKTEQFDNAYWTKANCTVTANSTTAPDGTTTADTVTYTGVGALNRAITSGNIPILSGQTVTKLVYLKNNGQQFIQIPFLLSASQYANFDLVNGTVTQTSASCTASIVNAGSGWYRCIATATYTGSGNDVAHIWAIDSGTAGYIAASTTASGIYIWGADLRPANQATGLIPTYQRVDTSSVYDTVGFPQYIKYGGINSSLSTASINFTATAQMTACVGLRKLSDASPYASVCELSASYSANSGAFTLNTPWDNRNFAVGISGTTSSNNGVTAGGSQIAPSSYVATGLFAINGATTADQVNLRLNTVLQTVTRGGATTGGGNFGTYPLYFGRRGGTTLPFNGNEFQTIIVGKTLTAAQITATETYVNSKTLAY